MLAVLSALTLAPQPAGADPTSPPCPTAGIPFSSQLTNGNVKIGRLQPATGASATACGVVVFTPQLTLQATIPRANLRFAPLSVPIGLLSITVQIVPASDFTGPVSFAADGTHIALSGQVVADAAVLLATCAIGPFGAGLTTDKSGALTGSPFTGAGTQLTGKLVGNDSPVPAAKATRECPGLVAGVLNAISGLPAPAGQSAITFDASLNLTPAAAAVLHR
jgi:hypothetical protein